MKYLNKIVILLVVLLSMSMQLKAQDVIVNPDINV